MSSSTAGNLAADSALLELQTRSTPSKEKGCQDVISAIRRDAELGRPLSKVAVSKHFSGNHTHSTADLVSLKDFLKTTAMKRLESDSEVALSYVHAAIIISNEIASR